MTKIGKLTILGIIAITVIVAVGIYWWQRGDVRLAQPPSDTSDWIVRDTQAVQALKAVESVANELTGLRTDNPLAFEIVDMDGRSANFGIMQSDGVRGERIVEEHMIIFQEIASWENNILTNNIAEVDSATNKVVAMHRTSSQNYGGDKSPEELEQIARQFVKRVYPEFSESTLEFDPGSKSAPEKATNHFFRWNDKQFAVPGGLDMDIPPFIQVGITASGFIFSYDNTVQLYHNLPKEDLRTLCGFVEMPRTDDSSINPEQGTVKVRFDEYEPVHQGRYLVLPYEPETDFEGCSESAKEFLRHLPNPYDKN